MGKQSSATSLFELNDFRDFVHSWVETKGRGEYRRIALELKMHTTLVSQIFQGRKCLTEEQASALCSYMGLNYLETDYFLKLVQIERAGTVHLKSLYKRHLEQLRSEATEIKTRVPAAKALTEQDRALFYSSWHYAVVRLLTSIPHFQTVEAISKKIRLSPLRVQHILDFLVSRDLCRESRGVYTRTDKNTHVEAASALAIRHHQNWRIKATELQESMTSSDMSFTAPVSISKEDIPKVRALLVEAISGISKVVQHSDSEEVVYLGIDWLKL